MPLLDLWILEVTNNQADNVLMYNLVWSASDSWRVWGQFGQFENVSRVSRPWEMAVDYQNGEQV